MIRISVIIPTFARPEALLNCLTKLAESDFPKEEFEVVVVDDGSPAPLDLPSSPFPGGFNLVMVRQENAGAGAARNLGVRKARGSYLLFTDDDCLPDRKWLTTMEASLTSDSASVAGGQTVNAASNNIYSRVSHLLAHKAYANYETDPSSVSFFGSNNFGLSRQAFEREGGFDEQLRPAYEDREFCDRLMAHGYRFVYLAAAIVAHDRRMRLRALLVQHIGYGRGGFRYYSRNRNLCRKSAASLILSTALQSMRESAGWGKIGAPFLVILSQFAAFLGYALTALARSPSRPLRRLAPAE